jgi:hypothetical protein
MLEKFPFSGRKVPEFDDENLRELIAYSYRIIYRVEPAEVIIASVIHGKRIWKSNSWMNPKGGFNGATRLSIWRRVFAWPVLH